MLLHELLTLGFGVALAMVFSIIFYLIRFFFVFDSDFLMHVSLSLLCLCVCLCVSVGRVKLHWLWWNKQNETMAQNRSQHR